MKLYNTLTRSLDDFTPLAPPAVTMYVCGPTVYDIPHIGHARSAFVFDVLRRYLTFKDYRVTFVRNVTDVDDKIIERAKAEPGAGDVASKCQAVAERYLAAYHEAMDRLGIQRPDVEPRATAHVVPHMTDFISQLLIRGVAYEAGGDVYFAVRKFEGYGQLSNRSLDELQAGAQVEPGEHPGPPSASAARPPGPPGANAGAGGVDEGRTGGAGKQDPLDFALWKASKPGEPSWKSPWGAGRPGWHIECSAMSTHYLKDAFDLHGGGVDLVFPHHENEVAQARAVGKPFARCWVHNGLLTVNGEKMSKSLGNYLTLEQVLGAYPHPDYLKIFFLKTQYRSPIDYAPAKMEESRKNWQEFSRFFQHYYQRKADTASGGLATVEVSKALEGFERAMNDDLNTPQALAVLFHLVNAGHRLLESDDPKAHLAARGVFDVLVECGAVLGLFRQGMSEEPPETLQRIQALVDERNTARKAKNFQRADAIREGLREEGYLLADTAGGTLWRRAG